MASWFFFLKINELLQSFLYGTPTLIVALSVPLVGSSRVAKASSPRKWSFRGIRNEKTLKKGFLKCLCIMQTIFLQIEVVQYNILLEKWKWETHFASSQVHLEVWFSRVHQFLFIPLLMGSLWFSRTNVWIANLAFLLP